MNLRTDAAVTSHEGFRLIYSLAAARKFVLGKVDIRGAYSQSGDAIREVFIRPPREMGLSNYVWLLLTTMYGLVSAGREWQLTSDCQLRKILDLTPSTWHASGAKMSSN